MWILKKWFHVWFHIRIIIIWQQGCFRYRDQGVPDPNHDVDFGFRAAAAGSHWVFVSNESVRRASDLGKLSRGAPPSDLGGPQRVTRAAAIEVGRCEWPWRRPAVSYCRHCPRRVTRAWVSDCEWLGKGRVTAGRGEWRLAQPGCCEWRRSATAASDSGRGELNGMLRSLAAHLERQHNCMAKPAADTAKAW